MIEIINFSSLPSPISKKTTECLLLLILGKDYELSLVWAKASLAKKINKKSRQKDYVPNILSFEISKNSGEIFICPEKAKTDCRNFSMSYKKFVIFLLIHGLLHLKGMKHGEKMEKAEKFYLTKILK